MPDTTTITPPTPVAAHPPVATPPQPPVVTKNPTDISSAFLSSLSKAMDHEKAGTRPDVTPGKPVDAVEDRFQGSNLGQIVKTLAREAKEKADATAAPVVPATPVVVASASTATVVPTEVPVVATPVVPVAVTPKEPVVRNPEVDKFKLPPIPQPTPAPVATNFSTLHLDLSGLNEDERAEMDTAIFAEQKHPDRYRGHAQKVLDYIKAHKRVVQEIEATGEDDVEENSRYKAFQKANKPNLTAAERRRLDQERISYEAAQEAKKEVSRELDDLRKQIAETRAGPIIERSLGEFRQVVQNILPKEDDPLVTQISNSFADVAVQAADQFVRLSNRQISYDTANPLHKGVADFIEDQAGQFIKSGDANLKRGNQTFVSRATYNTMPVEQRSKHFTFTDDDVLRILAVNAKQNAEAAIARERKRLEDAGYTRQAVKPVSAPALTSAQVIPDPSPRSGTGLVPTEPTVTSKPKDPFHAFLFDKGPSK